MRTFILGDIHGNFSAIESWLKNYAERGDALIQAGDFGAGFLHSERVKSLGRKFDDAGCRLYAIRGNHDNPAWFNENRKYGGVEFLRDTTRTINGNSFLFLGDAISVDRAFRKEDVTWWRKEPYVLDEDFLGRLVGVDYVVSHTCPGFAKPVSTMKKGLFLEQFFDVDDTLQQDLLEESKQMELTYNILKEKNNIKAWYFGHFHVSENMAIDNTKFQCLNIDEIVIV